MLFLAIDTATARGSVALARGVELLEAMSGDARQTHGQRLPGELQTLLARHGLTTAAVDCFVVAVGPGSFTGLRVGIATVQGLALAHNRPVLGVSVLDTLTEVGARLAGGTDRPDLIAPWIDAKRGEVFSALYEPDPSADTLGARRAAGQGWRVRVGPVAVPPVALLDIWADQFADHRVWVIGDGVAACRSLLDDRLGPGSRVVADPPLLAGVMAVMASAEPWRRRAAAPHVLRPVYVRRPDAELARDRRRLAER